MKIRAAIIGVILLLVATVVFMSLPGRDRDRTGARSAEQGVQSHSPNDEAERDAQAASDAPDQDPASAHRTELDGVEFEAASDERLRELRDQKIKWVTIDYSLMLKRLALAESEFTGMIEFLIEVAMSKTYMAGYQPAPIDEADRRAGIAALIGEAKLERFLVLEQDRFEYREAQLIANLLEASGVPLTAVNHDRLFDVLIVVRERQQASVAPNVESGTLEWVETMNATLNDYERLVLELSPSVLTAAQQELLYDRYHSLWTRRAAYFEIQKQMKADDEEYVPSSYIPRQ